MDSRSTAPASAPQQSNSTPPQRAPPSYAPRPAAVEDDDDEDDDDDSDDDLDDLLDEFSEVSKPVPPTQSSSAPNPVKDDDLEDDFSRELQLGMADLLGELENSPELQEQFEHLVKELSDAATTDPVAGPSTSTSTSVPRASPSSTTAAPTPNFSDTINRTMSRLQESGETISSEVADSESDDFLAEMLKQMGSMSGVGDNEEDFSKMLLNMMEQLTNKDILYEPMRELADKYPAWMERNQEKYTREEMAKYREQYSHVKEICAKFEEPSYRDSSTVDREFIVERMQKMQAAGSPPAELMGGMSEGLDIPPDMENSCPVQ
ncbi:Pex19 protein family-domain-containing protein [Peziza echinospora]|nr:Pex19 protein family-domain-containing protein [Peziza echinospora]